MLNDKPLTPSEAVTDTSLDFSVILLLQEALASHLSSVFDTVIAPLIRRACRCIGRIFRHLFGGGKPHAQPRPRNTRIQRVQARRKQLNLDQDGKYPALRSRKASYAFAHEVERWCEQKRDAPPRPRDFEHRPARRRKREARRQLKWKPMQASEQEIAWMDTLHANTCEICAAFGISERLLTGELSTFNVDNSLRTAHATQESEQSNG